MRLCGRWYHLKAGLGTSVLLSETQKVTEQEGSNGRKALGPLQNVAF